MPYRDNKWRRLVSNLRPGGIHLAGYQLGPPSGILIKLTSNTFGSSLNPAATAPVPDRETARRRTRRRSVNMHPLATRLRIWTGRYGASFSYVGLAAASLFLAASVTPSLLPRNVVVQGVLSGFALAVGYG